MNRKWLKNCNFVFRVTEDHTLWRADVLS